jgi:hypothetical protein
MYEEALFGRQRIYKAKYPLPTFQNSIVENKIFG